MSDEILEQSRKPLAVDNEYEYKGYKNSGFRIVAMSLPNHPSDDGALPGICIKWAELYNRSTGWWPFKSEEQFWNHELFRNAYDKTDSPEAKDNARN